LSNPLKSEMYGTIGKYISSEYVIYEKELRFYTEDEILRELVRRLPKDFVDHKMNGKKVKLTLEITD